MRSMQLSSKLLFKTAIVLLGIMLAATVFVVMNSQRADALSGGQWATVQQYVNKYINDQYDKGPDGVAGTADDPKEGEAGFIVNSDWLKVRIDNNAGGDNVYLGEGDDAALAPVLIDNLNQSDVIPGTSIQCTWNSGLGTTNCFDVSKVNAVKAKVDAHQAAGFSTDVVDYCLSGHTEASTTGAWGYIAQTGGLSSDGSIPKVYAFKWGRNGWQGLANSYPNTGPIGASGSASSYADATNSTPCNDATSDSELVRCTAQWAIYSGNGPWGNGGSSIAGGNIGNGQSPNTLAPYSASNPDLAAGQIVDIRVPSPANTIVDANGPSPTVQIPVNTIFNNGRSALNSTLAPGATGILVAGRTQMMGGIVAVGLKMLGYPMATNGFLNSGMPKWNNTMDEKQVAGNAYPLKPKASIDTSAPVVSSLVAENVTATSVDIHRVANEPATMKIEYGTSPGVYTNTANNTLLNANKTVQLTGLSPSTTYYYKVTSYDGLANGTPSAEGSFYTGDQDDPVTTDNAPAGWQNGPVTVNLTCTDAVSTNGFPPSGCASTTYEVEGGSTQPGNSVAVSGDGTHVITYRSTDNAGNNESTKTATVKIDTTAPSVTYTGPTGTVPSSSVLIKGTTSDPGAGDDPPTGSGVASASLSLSLNGGPPTTYNNCTVDGSGNIDCSVSGLANGTYNAVITVADGALPAGNTGSASGSFEVFFTCDPNPPALSYGLDNGRYASVVDYVYRLVSVDLTVTNTGNFTAGSVKVTGATATKKVSLATPVPATIGDIAPDSSATITLKYKLPLNRPSSFDTTIDIEALSECDDPFNSQAQGTVNVPLLP